MKAVNVDFVDFIGSKAQYLIPIYQRKYSWELVDCKRLFDDIINVAKDSKRPCHFIGSIIYLAKDEIQHASAIKEYLVIDGQQRLTTLALLLLALGRYTLKKCTADGVEDTNLPTSLNAIMEDYLVNKREQGDLYFKMKLGNEDFSNYKQLIKKINEADLETRPGTRIFANYNYFLSRMEKERIAPQTIFEGIKKLVVIDTCLAPEDNPQLVFETVNSTGRELTVPDKIRNFILMTVSPADQNRLYADYWHPMELSLGVTTRGEEWRFSTFFKYYMSVVTRKRVGNDYYNDFKDYYFRSSHDSTESLVRHIYRFSKHYLLWEKSSEDSCGVDYALYKIKSLGQHNITPAILRVIDDLSNGLISESDAIKVLSIIESYWARRRLCELPTNTAGPVCIVILKSLGAGRYVDNVIQTIISKLTPAQRMPSDNEMLQTMHTRNIFEDSYWKRRLLDLLEKHESREYVHNDAFSVEHIMPQTIRETDDNDKDWIADLGPNWEHIQKTYLHTLGNLTLTGFNTEYSNYRFIVKRDMKDGYAHTPIRISAMLADLDTWGEKEIIERCDELTKIILDIWKYPTIQS